jgi:flagellar basal-body rod protein FlgB
MNSLFSSVMIKALDGLTVRATVTAENIANAGTQNYRPRSVSFESALAKAAADGDRAVQAVKPLIGPDTDVMASSGSRLDLELATASSTATRYEALIEIFNRQMQINALPLTGSR